ncbi:hypothetical protein [Bythopirellula goksoeyrii]|nr:hypothetical protein [Bythopirellula goksoeyrii]
MKSHQGVLFVVLLVLAGATPATQAALTPISNLHPTLSEPQLIGPDPLAPTRTDPSLLETLYGEINLRRVDDAQDSFFQHMDAEASVRAVARFNNPTLSEQLYFYNRATMIQQAFLGFQQVATSPRPLYPVGIDPPTTGSGLIPRSESGNVFELRLNGLRSSNRQAHPSGQDFMVTFEIIGAAGHPDNVVGNYIVGFEAFPNDDLDYQDLVFELSGVVPVPEPGTWLLGLLAAMQFSSGWVRCRPCLEGITVRTLRSSRA